MRSRFRLSGLIIYVTRNCAAPAPTTRLTTAMLNGGAGLILENEQASRWLVTDETDTERPIDELARGIGDPVNQDPGTIGGTDAIDF